MSNYTTIYMVRHGETSANATHTIQGQSDVPLNESGIFQAGLIAARLKFRAFAAIYSSDLSRAMVTAQKIANGREVIADPELREWHLGHWQGMNIADVKAEFPEEYAAFHRDDPGAVIAGGESSAEFLSRVSRVMEKLAARHPGGDILCITHGGFVSKALKYVMQYDAAPLPPCMDNTALFAFRTLDGKHWQLQCWNDTAHLENTALVDASAL